MCLPLFCSLGNGCFDSRGGAPLFDVASATEAFADAWPAPRVCARAARAIITVRTTMNGAIPRRTLVLRVSLRVMGDLLCHGIRGPGSATYRSALRGDSILQVLSGDRVRTDCFRVVVMSRLHHLGSLSRTR